MNIEVVVDDSAYNQFQGELTRILAVIVRRELTDAGLLPDQVRQLTGKIVFSLTTLFDGSWMLSHNDKTLEPKVLFRYDGDKAPLIWAEGGSYMHEIMYGYIRMLFDEKVET